MTRADDGIDFVQTANDVASECLTHIIYSEV